MTLASTSHPSWVQTFALKVLGIAEGFWEFICPTVKADTQALLVALAPIAVSVVESLASSTKSGEDKRQVAITQITSAAKDSGIQAGASIVNLAIEYAVQNLNK